jgi:excinuclease ABC subunit C
VEVPALIARKLAALPDRPGVYLWKNAAGEILYIGKAKSLRSRVPSYVGASSAFDEAATPMHEALTRQLADLETIIVPNEAQALLLENNLIKEHRPRFNVLLRDDKSYPRIAVTVGEPFPRVLVVRRVTVDGARYFGPYTDVATLRNTLRIIRRLFTVRSCHYALPEDHPDRPCLDYHIERCRAPCVGYQSRQDYGRMIDDVLLFLEGKTVDVRQRLRERMQQASTALDFERAAQLRDAIGWLEQLEQPQTIELVGGGDADAIGFARDGDDACGVILRVRAGRVIAREHRFLEHAEHEADGAILSAFLVRYYLPLEARATRVMLPFAPPVEDLEPLQQLAPEIEWHVPQRGTNAKLVELADQNARHLLESLLIETFDIEERAADPVYALGRDLGLAVVPRAFVCIDISTNQGRDTVGSLVWFEAGRPRKAEYRRFRIRGPGQQDDFAAVHEVVTRFLKRRLEEGTNLPDLMVIDGGKGQLGAALVAARALGQGTLPIVSLAKKEEEVFLPDRSDSLRLSRRSPSLKLLQRARDEAHRFAVSYSRRRRTQRTLTSELLTIPGIGPGRRRRLLERFGSLAGVKTASAAEIATLPGFSTTLAERILETLNGHA